LERRTTPAAQLRWAAAALVLACHLGLNFPTDVEASRHWYVDDMLKPELTVADGWISLPVGAGLGYDVDAGKLAQSGVERREFKA